MDVMYVVGRGSKHDNAELRWSLRALETHGKNLGRVIVVGYLPDWLTGVEYFGVHDKADATFKHENILNCILTACREGVVTGEFLYSSDDHFLVKDIDLDNYPFWIRSKAPFDTDLRAAGRKVGRWRQSCSDTRRLLLSEGYTDYRFSCHADTHMHAADAPEVQRLAIAGRYKGFLFGFEPTDLFNNVRLKREPLHLVDRKDRKIKTFSTDDEATAAIGDLDTFSIGDGCFDNPDFAPFMEHMFPGKSRFEK